MSSILTNTSAMVALQTLKGINSSLNQVQSEISTGKAIGSARDNAAIWAISKVMESDVKGFDAISSSLNLGASTVGVARVASEKVTDLLTEMKKTIVGSQEENVDRVKLQADVTALSDQIRSIVGAAQFNGLNLVNGKMSTTNVNSGNIGVNILSSLDRSSDGAVVASSIGVDAQNLSTDAGAVLTAGGAMSGGDTAGGVTTFGASGGNDAVTFNTFDFQGGAGALSRTDADADGADLTSLIEGDQLKVKIGSIIGTYTVKTGDTAASVVTGLKDSLVANGIDTTRFEIDAATDATELVITNTYNTDDTEVSFEMSRGSGALAALATLDVSTEAGAASALSEIEYMIQAATEAAAAFGSAGKRIELQASFVSELSDALTTGIGSLVDADMEEASARLQALQTQQQLGIQALSIANQAPQNILSLFR